jgi:hypothetical protein
MEEKQYFNGSFLLASYQLSSEKYSGDSHNWNQPKQINIKYKYWWQHREETKT